MTINLNLEETEMSLLVRQEYDADYIAYYGGIEDTHADTMISVCRNKKRKNVILHLVTNGGDPHAAYRIARELQRTYSEKSEKESDKRDGCFYLFINGVCKSAGTLLALGADVIIMDEHAQLGPIDVQVKRQDEVGEHTSGLTPIESLKFLNENSMDLFRDTFWRLRFGQEFTTRLAAEISAQITTGLMGKIYQQMDPIRLGEIYRSTQIAKEYGERLQKGRNAKSNALDKLISGYPSHSSVIDKQEAYELFEKVKDPSESLLKLANETEDFAEFCIEQGRCFIIRSSSESDDASDEPSTSESKKDNDDKSENRPTEQQESSKQGEDV